MLTKTKILTISRDPVLVSILQQGLNGGEYEIVNTQHTGYQLKEVVDAEQPAFIILDIIMPTKDGFMVCEELKKDPQLSKIPVMLLTSLSSRMAETAVSMTQAMTTEAEDYLEKPASPEELFQRVEKLLRKQSRTGR